MTKITFITTLNHNIGDDFVREGLEFLLSRHFDDNVEFSYIHKHAPVTVRYGFEKIKSPLLSKIMDSLIPTTLTADRLAQANLVVQSGAPVYWCHPDNHCANNEWYQPLIKKRLVSKSNRTVKLLNLAAGTCQRYFSTGNEYCRTCQDYIKELFMLSSVTSVRDQLAQTLLQSLGLDAPLIPCSSIFAIDKFNFKAQQGEYVVINYMRGGGHYGFEQNINTLNWENSIKEFYKKISKYESVVFACHNEKELALAKKVDPSGNFFLANNHIDYMKLYSRAKFGIMNRVHGAFLLASYGRPSVVIGTDTRARMAQLIDIESFFVNDITVDMLLDRYEKLNKETTDYAERFYQIKSEAYENYMNLLASF